MNEKNFKFEKLTPIKNVDLKIYDEAINFIFDNDDIKNIAISGAYGAGKSSILETYKSKNPNIKFIHISLAHFESANTYSNSESLNTGSKQNNLDSNNHIEAVLEGKILNQLIHQINPTQIPQTQFKVKQTVSLKEIILNVSGITKFLILTAYIANFSTWCKFIWNFVLTLKIKILIYFLMFTTTSVAFLLSGCLYTALVTFAIYIIVKTQKNKNIFKKFNFKGAEIELFAENNDSYFDKYLNEVLYIFENSNANAIVFEDIDRYNMDQIFEKLREINSLVNNKLFINKKKSIRFFYLLKDDIFVSKDRTKFFDFILPIIPVVDSSNSYDQFIKIFKQGDILGLFDKKFLQDLSLYIDDMRILKNVYNEFVIYHNRIQATELDCNKLLAILVYKNIFPRDFSNLQLGVGFVHTLFGSKSEIIDIEMQKIGSRIQEIEEKIKLTEDEQVVNIDELDTIYLNLNTNNIDVAGKREDRFKTRALFIGEIKNNFSEVYITINGYRNTFNIKPYFNKLKEDLEYVERRAAIERKVGDQIEKLKFEIQKLHQQRSAIKNSRLREVINKGNIESIFIVNFVNEIGEETKFEEIKVSPYFPLIKYLMREGYIDETYQDYMTYFYGDSLSEIDKKFLRSVTDQKPKEYTYELKNPQLVISRLREVDFDHEEILNFDLLSYLLKTKKTNATILDHFLHQLISTKKLNFIAEFWETRKEKGLFVRDLNHLWSSIYQYILTESEFTISQKKQYAIDTLYYSMNEDIESVNENNCLSNFISHTSDFLNIFAPNIDKLINGFTLLGVRFTWIEHDQSDNDLFNAVYKNNLYQLTFDLICLMLETAYRIQKSDDFRHKNYTLIISKIDEPLAIYVKENINNYLRTVLDNCEGYIIDSESAVLEILNNTKVEQVLKKEYIDLLQTEIELLENVEDKDLWSKLFQKENVSYSEENILRYFFSREEKLDANLIRFINSRKENLNFDTDYIDNKFGIDASSRFFDSVIECNDLSNERYESILKSLGFYYESFDITGVEDEKIEILVNLNTIIMTNSALLFMRENYPDQMKNFILRNIAKYAEDVINEGNFHLSEILSLLEESLDDNYKIKLLQHTAESLSLKDKNYSEVVKLHILEHNLDINDLQFIFDCYSRKSVAMKNAIRDLSINHIEDILISKYPISHELLSELFRSDKLTSDTKKKLLLLYLPEMNEDQVKEYLITLNMNDFLSLFDQKRPKFEINEFNRRLLEIFENNNWITKFEVDKANPEYYRATGRKILLYPKTNSRIKR